MTENVTQFRGVEVLGISITSLTDAFGPLTPVVQGVLAKGGIQNVHGDLWYPVDDLVSALQHVAAEVGENAMFEMGKRVHGSARWPPHITDVHAALTSVNMAYHMNHRDESGPLCDPATGLLRTRIGGYFYRRTGPRSGVMVCTTPYPSDFERGILVGVARKWRPLANAELDPSAPTRKRGGRSCTFVIEW